MMVFRRFHLGQSACTAGFAFSSLIHFCRTILSIFKTNALAFVITCILASLTGAVVMPNSVMAAEALDNTAQRDYAIPASQLGDALAQFAAASGVPLSFDPQILSGLSSKGLQGRYTIRAGFSRLLAGSGYELVEAGNGGYSLRRVTAGESGVVTLAPVTVTGTAISPSDLPPVYAGGQVARGGRVGLLGNRDVMDTPFSVTQYTSQLIEDQQAQNIGEVLVNDVSVRNSHSRGAAREEFNVRGFTLFNREVTFNGLSSITPHLAGALIGIERVEVLKGPNAFLNGMAPSGSVGGGINLVPKRADEEPLNRVTLSYVSKSQLGTQADIARRFSEGRFGVRVNGAYRNGDMPVNNNSEKLAATTIGLDYQGQGFRVEGDLMYQYRRTTGRAGLLFPGPIEISAPDASTNFMPSWSYQRFNEWGGALRTEVDLAQKWTAFASIGGRKSDINGVEVGGELLDEAGNLAVYSGVNDQFFRVLTGDTGLRGRFETGTLSHQAVLSGSFFDQKSGLLSAFGPDLESNIYRPVAG